MIKYQSFNGSASQGCEITSISPIVQLLSRLLFQFTESLIYFIEDLTPGDRLTIFLFKTRRKYGDQLGMVSFPSAGTKFQNSALAKSFSMKCMSFHGQGSGVYHQNNFSSLSMPELEFFLRISLQKPGRVMGEKPMKVLGGPIRLQPLTGFQKLTFKCFYQFMAPVSGPQL